jgi:hypothetical protein
VSEAAAREPALVFENGWAVGEDADDTAVDAHRKLIDRCFSIVSRAWLAEFWSFTVTTGRLIQA